MSQSNGRERIPTANDPNACVLVIIGASGDLTRRKLLPAIYNLAESGHLPKAFAILGVGRPAQDDEAFRHEMREYVEKEEGEPLDADKWATVEERLHYVSGDLQIRISMRR